MRRNIRIFTFILMLLCPLCVNARNVTEILSAFDAAKNNERVKIAEEFFGALNAMKFFDEPYSMPKDWPADSVCAEVWINAGYYFFDKNDFKRCILYTNKAYAIFRNGNQTEKLAECLSHLSVSYIRVSDYSNAIRYGEEVLAIDRKIGNKSNISSDLGNIAAMYLATKNIKEAKKFILEAIEYSTSAGDSLRMAIQLGIASEVYQNQGDYREALNYAKRAYQIDSIGGRSGKAAIRLCQMAAAQIEAGSLQNAKKNLLRALPELEKCGNKQSYSIACNQLGLIALKNNNMSEAARYYNKSYEFFHNSGDLFNESKTLEGLYKALKTSDPKTAMSHLERFAELKDSLYRKEMQELISDYNAKYRNDELQGKYDYENRMRHIFIWSASIILLLAVGVILLLLKINRQRKRTNHIIRQSEKSRTNFFTNITHEFRTPLTIIRAAASETLRHTDDSQTTKDMENILRQQERLLNLINQLLEISKLAADGRQQKPAIHGDIVGLLTMICESSRPSAEQKGISLIFNASQNEIAMDYVPEYIERIVQNLISNAMKFSDKGGTVEVTAHVDGKMLVLAVSDHGCGMTAEQCSHVFEPFYQAADNSRGIGTGIGLSLVALTAKVMGGTISVESEPGKGSLFTVSLPIKNEASAAGDIERIESIEKIEKIDTDKKIEKIENLETSDDDTLRILIVEDTPEVAQYMARQLGPQYEFHIAADGEEGLAKAEQLVPDMIITDVMMPGMDGFELTEKIRHSELLAHIPVIIVTARSTHQDRMRGLEAGADAYLEKPFHADELAVRVQKLMEQRQLLREKFSAAVSGSEVIGEDEKAVENLLSPADRIFVDKFTAAVNNVIALGKIDYDALASEMFLGRAQLNRKIKAITGMTVTEFILQLRIKMAKELLTTTDLTVSEVAYHCGMDNISYFTTLFKKVTGVTPGQYRK